MAKKTTDKLKHFGVSVNASGNLLSEFKKEMKSINKERRLNGKSVITNGLLTVRMVASFVDNPEKLLEDINYDKAD